MKARNRYEAIIEKVFFAHYKQGATEVEFSREEFETYANELGIRLPKNLGDIIYSFRFRTPLPEAIQRCAPEGMQWVIRLAGKARYAFVATRNSVVVPNPLLSKIKIPDATPQIISAYALSDEQALLAKLRYNRLIDIFARVTCYSLQNHLRTTVPFIGQVETDEIYVGVDRTGTHYVLPVQAKGPKDNLSIVQIEQDLALCADKFPALVARPIGTQFLDGDTIALFEFELSGGDIRIVNEKHYQLVPNGSITEEDLRSYRRRSELEE